VQSSSHRRRLLWLLLPCLLGGCGEPSAKPSAKPPPAELTWFSVGETASGAGDSLLAFDPYPRWFVGGSEQVSEAELARRRAEQDIVVHEAESLHSSDQPGMRWIAVLPPRPRRVEDLPTTQARARLELDVTHVANNELQLELTLHAGDRALWRELEHRSTNLVPFLFSLDVDGVPLRLPSTGSAHCGGIERFETVAAAGGSRRWKLRVTRASVRALVVGIRGVSPIKSVGFVAAFSERKHIGWAAYDGEHPSPALLELPFKGEPILIRSKRVAVPWDR
jgi:hypothetical protein